MEIVVIKSEDAKLFGHLDPYGLIDRIGFPGAFGLGVIMPGTKSDIVAGLLVATIEGGRLVIEWLATDPECREQGVAGELLKQAFLAAEKLELSEVAVRLTDRMTDPDFGRDPEPYFRDFLFDKEEDGPDYYMIPVSEISKSKDLASKVSDSGIRPLRELSAAEKNQLIAFMSDCEDVYVVPEYISDLSVLDPTLSFVSLAENKVSGAFLTISAGKYHYSVFLGVTSDHIAFSLEQAVAAASEELHISDVLQIRDNGDFTPFMLRGAGNIAKIRQKLLVAEVADFTEYAKSEP